MIQLFSKRIFLVLNRKIKKFCNACRTKLYKGSIGDQMCFPCSLPMLWREPQNHVNDCYFCLSILVGMSSKNWNGCSNVIENPFSLFPSGFLPCQLKWYQGRARRRATPRFTRNREKTIKIIVIRVCLACVMADVAPSAVNYRYFVPRNFFANTLNIPSNEKLEVRSVLCNERDKEPLHTLFVVMRLTVLNSNALYPIVVGGEGQSAPRCRERSLKGISSAILVFNFLIILRTITYRRTYSSSSK